MVGLPNSILWDRQLSKLLTSQHDHVNIFTWGTNSKITAIKKTLIYSLLHIHPIGLQKMRTLSFDQRDARSVFKVCLSSVKTKGARTGIIAEIVQTEMSELLPQNDIKEWLNVRESLTGTNLKNFFMCE